MADMESLCLFDKLYSCSRSKDALSQARADRVIKASKQYGDEIYVELEQQLEHDKTLAVPVHCKCIDKYCRKKKHPKSFARQRQSVAKYV